MVNTTLKKKKDVKYKEPNFIPQGTRKSPKLAEGRK